MGEINELLRAASAGDRSASDRLFSAMYDELRRVAHRMLLRSGGPTGLDTTVVVHEVFLKLTAANQCTPADRLAFYSYVGKVMRSVVLDTIRESRARKRGGDRVLVPLTTGLIDETPAGPDPVDLDEALTQLGALAPDLRDLVEMRFYAGLTIPEISELTGKPVRSLERDWTKARLLLRGLIAER